MGVAANYHDRVATAHRFEVVLDRHKKSPAASLPPGSTPE
ncbi:hypothetical protein BN1012_Phect2155 [Candidatus Phaeomarinobacter ectocarpi]|uniref:Uncharacterized protein n=1 Tax=Candidatus Phaeomarinibacter ectocarpi TaxID=1458461 RepID=X5M9Q6_9HYPH|nr:hypothetical protein BN1012_Phect2155 [Candidatus Phaeomarinobacter ectocarpi]